jgi:transketolase C-terminal domain/subunit
MPATAHVPDPGTGQSHQAIDDVALMRAIPVIFGDEHRLSLDRADVLTPAGGVTAENHTVVGGLGTAVAEDGEYAPA